MNEMMELEETNKYRSNVFLNKLIICILIISAFAILIYGYNFNVRYNKATDLIINKIHELENINDKMRNTENDIKIVNNFNIERDTFQFRNFPSSFSQGGCSRAILGIELLNFEGRLINKNIITKPLNEYVINQKDLEAVYGEGETLQYRNNFQFDITDKDISEGRTNEIYKDIIDITTGRKKNNKKSKKRDVYFDEAKIKDKELENILLEISKHQQIINYYPDLVYSKVNYEKNINSLADGFDNIDVNYSTDTIVRNILDRMNDEKLVEVTISNKYRAQSLLIYGYDMVDSNNIKFYVADCNIPINKNQTEKVNNDIKNNGYMLFTKDVLNKDNEWSYIYQPVINDKPMYLNYNSFIPGTRFILMHVLTS